MDLAELLDVTEPVECEFMGKEVVAHVYINGPERLTKEERAILRKLGGIHRLSAEELAALPEEARADEEWNAVAVSIDDIRAMLPVVLKGIDFEGTPLTYRGMDFPENVSLYPDTLLVAIGNPVIEFWQQKANPTNGATAPNGSQPEGKPENSQIENTSLESKSPSPLIG